MPQSLTACPTPFMIFFGGRCTADLALVFVPSGPVVAVGAGVTGRYVRPGPLRILPLASIVAVLTTNVGVNWCG
jgi:hypothetical protein